MTISRHSMLAQRQKPLSKAAQRQKPLSKADKIAVLLCHLSGLTSLQIAVHFDRTRRYVNMIICDLKREMPDLIEAVDIHKRIMMCYQDEEADDEIEWETTSVDPCTRDTFCAVQARQLARLREKIQRLQLKKAKLRHIIDGLKTKQVDCTTHSLPSEQSWGSLCPSILQEMLAMIGAEKNCRRYSEEFYRFSYIFCTLSPRAYRYVRKVLILPSNMSLWRHFNGSIKSMKSYVTELDSTHKLLDAFLESRSPESGRITATLAVDAFAFRLFLRQIASLSKIKETLSQSQLQALEPLLEDRQLIQAISDLEDDDAVEDDAPSSSTYESTSIEGLFDAYNHCFMYVLIPLDKSIPTLTLHLSPARSGSAKECHLQILDELTKLCADHKIDITYMSCDGDAGWNVKFHEMFEFVASHFDRPLCEAAEAVRKDCSEQEIHMATSDLLHLLKRARGRYLDHIILPLASGTAKTDYAHVCNLLQLGPTLSDKSQLGRMRDFYPIEMFSVTNVIKLLRYKRFADAFYFLPFALLLLVIRVPFFRLDFRLQLLETAYLLFRQAYEDILAMKAKKKTEAPIDSSSKETEGVEKIRAVQRPRDGSTLATFAELGTIERILCTIISYASALLTHPSNLRTDSLGTHIVEQKIGQARHGMDNRWSRLLSVLTQSVLRSIMLGIDGINMSSPGRLKTAGCCLDETADFHIEGFDHILVSRVIVHSLSDAARAADDFDESLKSVLSWLQKINAVISSRSTEIGKVWLPNPSANSGIMARLLKTQIESVEAPK